MTCKHSLFTCITCDPAGETSSPEALGNKMYQAVKAAVAADADLNEKLRVVPVKCMGSCKRPCSVAFAGEDKNTLLFAEMHPEQHVQDVVAFARLFVHNPIGTTPKEKRPASMQETLAFKVPPYSVADKK
jgi:predicted metal-binding protein